MGPAQGRGASNRAETKGSPVTRICMQCKVEFGEKCPECGAVTTLLSTDGSMYLCPLCFHSFPKNEGGPTHGLCEGCRAQWGLTGKVDDGKKKYSTGAR